MSEPKELTTKNYQEEYDNRLENIKNNLYLGGGVGQAHSFLTAMMTGLNKPADIDPTLVLNDIGNILKTYQQLISTSGIVPVKNFFTGREHNAYACLDNDLKFCVKHYFFCLIPFIKFINRLKNFLAVFVILIIRADFYTKEFCALYKTINHVILLLPKALTISYIYPVIYIHPFGIAYQ